MRKYEEWELIQVPARKANGYRVFTDIHIDQIHMAKKAFQIDVLQAGLRVKIIAAVKCSAKYQFDQAISCVQEYLEIADKEIKNATDVVSIVEELKKPPLNDTSYLKRSEAARELGLTIDTIRNWEMNGLIKVKRKENGYRVYNTSDMNRLRIIRSLRCANYSLSSILRMLNAMDRQKNVDIFKLLNTPNEDEDIIQACDKLIYSLNKAKKNAGEVLEMLIEMKNKY